MRILTDILGLVLIVLVVQDAFETVILPHRIARRIRITRFSSSHRGGIDQQSIFPMVPEAREKGTLARRSGRNHALFRPKPPHLLR
jgi:UPF0716 family protein affecting phage T7 exclusion